MKKSWFKLLLIVIIFLFSLFVSLPNGVNFSVGNFSFSKKYDLKLGLDLAGGSRLVFDVDTSSLDSEKRKLALESIKEVIERRINLFGVNEPSIVLSEFEGKNRVTAEIPGITDTKEAVNLIGKTAQLQFAEIEETESTTSASLKATELTGSHIKSSTVTFDQNNGKPNISLVFNDEGARLFEDLTEKNIGKPLVIILDDQIISQPMVQEKIAGGQAVINGDFTLDEAKKMVIQLNAGALPVPIKLIEERTIGPSLGSDSVSKSVFSGLVGIGLVIVFMILNYGWLGLISGFGLIIFATISIALYKLIPITLTLPGIAGLALSIGMAVDSNILIFERFKEEKLRRNIADALEVSFGRAWDSIRDANIATLITAFILANPMEWSFLPLSGPIRGFAVTLALGIAISLFTGIFVSRNLLRLFVKK